MKKLGVTLIWAVLLFLPVSALSEKLKFVTAEWPPMVTKDKHLPGTAMETVREVCKRLGIEPKIRILPWKRAVKYVKKGKADAIFAPKKTEERLRFLYFVDEPLYMERLVVIARKGSGMNASGLDDLKDKNFAVVRGYSYGAEFDKCQGLKKIVCGNDTQLVKILYKGRTDLAAGEERNLEWIRKDLGFKESFETVYFLTEDPNFLAFSKKALGPRGKVLAREFTRILRQLKEEGVFRKIEGKYY
ncbi:transporter substrate-binding domain-containing protein [Desulfobacterales bacterium HSG2]|nr:transporter substrate-binding domain-containing protein [Desulfobacterales bacterium HSG2]